MSCSHVHDFITGTTIALAHATIGQFADCEAADSEGWDILRPNRKAAALVAQHVEALKALNINRNPEIAVQ